MSETKASLKSGWAKPANSRKWHYFVGGMALCGRWMYSGEVDETSIPSSGPDDCAACARKDRAMKARPQPETSA